MNIRPPQLHEYIHLYMGFVRGGNFLCTSDDSLPHQGPHRRGRCKFVRISLFIRWLGLTVLITAAKARRVPLRVRWS